MYTNTFAGANATSAQIFVVVKGFADPANLHER